MKTQTTTRSTTSIFSCLLGFQGELRQNHLRASRILLIAMFAVLCQLSLAAQDSFMYGINNDYAGNIYIYQMRKANDINGLGGEVLQTFSDNICGKWGTGIAQVGDYLYYTTASSNAIYRIYIPTGTNDGCSSFNATQSSGQLGGLAYDGSSFWILDENSSKVLKYNASSYAYISTTKKLSLCSGCLALGWFVDPSGTPRLIANREALNSDPYDVYDLSGNLVEPSLIAPYFNNQGGIVWDGSTLYTSDWNLSQVDGWNQSGQITSAGFSIFGWPYGYPPNVSALATVGVPPVVVPPVVVPPKCVQPPNSMVAWYPFDQAGSVQQDLANSNSAAAYNTVGSPGEVLGALSFDGIDAYVEAADTSSLNMGTEDLSIDAWVKISSSADDRGVVVLVDKRQSSPILGYHLFLYNGRLGLQLADSSGYANYVSTTAVPADNQWHLIAVTVARTSHTGGVWYLDGYQIDQPFDPTGHAGSLNSIGTPLLIGVRESGLGGAGFFKGALDELEIFNRVLTATEVQSLYQAGSAGKCK